MRVMPSNSISLHVLHALIISLAAQKENNEVWQWGGGKMEGEKPPCNIAAALHESE